MANKRISKLQRWILEACSQNIELQRTDAWAFFGKRFPPRYLKDDAKHHISAWELERYYKDDRDKIEERTKTVMERRHRLQKRVPVTQTYYIPKKQFILTLANESSISRSLTNLMRKGLMERSDNYGNYYALTERGFVAVKKNNPELKLLNFKQYQKEVTERRKARQKAWSSIGTGVFPSVEKKQKMSDLQIKEGEFRKKFTTASIYRRLCDKCQKKMARFEKACGATTIKRLRDEIGRMQ